MKKNNQIGPGAILSYISLGISNVIAILYTPIMLRLLGQSEFGLYNLSDSVIGYLGILEFGFGNAIVRYTSRYKAKEDKEGEGRVIGLFIIVYSIIALIVLIAGSSLIMNIDKLFSKSLSLHELGEMKILMKLMIFNLVVSLPAGVFGAVISAYEKFIFQKILEIIKAVLNPLIILPLLLIGFKSVAMTIAMTVINLLYLILNIYYCFSILKIKVIFKKPDFKILREVLGYSFYIFLGIIVDKIYWNTDQFILGAVSGTAVVAVYSIGTIFTRHYIHFSAVIESIFLPKVTKMVAKDASDTELSNLFIKAARIQFIFMSFILSVFLVIGYEFVRVWAGTEYSDSYIIALIIMVPLIIPSIQNIGVTILQAKNMQKFRSILYILIALFNIILSIPLAKYYGGIGSALSTSFAMIIGHILVMNIYYRKVIKIDISRFWREILKMSIPLTISIVITFIIKRLLFINEIEKIIGTFFIYSIMFGIFMWRYGINEEEKNMFFNVIKRLGIRKKLDLIFVNDKK